MVAMTRAASVCADDNSFLDLVFAVPGNESMASDVKEEQVELNFTIVGDGVVVIAWRGIKKDDGAGEEKDDKVSHATSEVKEVDAERHCSPGGEKCQPVPNKVLHGQSGTGVAIHT
jgi:hypothetical protein